MAEQDAPKQRRDLRERRRVRQERSAARQQAAWKQRFDNAQTPLELLDVAHDLLRARLVQWERKAAKAVARADGDAATTKAQQRLDEARADVERICGEAARFLAETAQQLDTTRK